MLDGRLQGVSGISPRLATGPTRRSSRVRLRFEINPVDMKAPGGGLIIRKFCGVAKRSAEDCVSAAINVVWVPRDRK